MLHKTKAKNIYIFNLIIIHFTVYQQKITKEFELKTRYHPHKVSNNTTLRVPRTQVPYTILHHNLFYFIPDFNYHIYNTTRYSQAPRNTSDSIHPSNNKIKQRDLNLDKQLYTNFVRFLYNSIIQFYFILIF
jgi:hypothetical protein